MRRLRFEFRFSPFSLAISDSAPRANYGKVEQGDSEKLCFDVNFIVLHSRLYALSLRCRILSIEIPLPFFLSPLATRSVVLLRSRLPTLPCFFFKKEPCTCSALWKRETRQSKKQPTNRCDRILHTGLRSYTCVSVYVYTHIYAPVEMYITYKHTQIDMFTFT